MWDQRLGRLAEQRLDEAYAAAALARLAADAVATPGLARERRLRRAVGVVLVRWGTRLLTASPAVTTSPAR